MDFAFSKLLRLFQRFSGAGAAAALATRYSEADLLGRHWRLPLCEAAGDGEFRWPKVQDGLMRLLPEPEAHDSD